MMEEMQNARKKSYRATKSREAKYEPRQTKFALESGFRRSAKNTGEGVFFDKKIHYDSFPHSTDIYSVLCGLTP